jgi:hypothetical protein
MKSQHVWRIILLVAVALTFTLVETSAQRRRGQGSGMPRYDTSTEVVVRGTVGKVESHTGRMGWAGTHLVVRFDAETLTVHVGPSSYLAQQGFSFAEGDQIEVTGSKVRFEGGDVLVAREIRVGDKSLTLRNRQGIPAWSRSRWRY